VCKIGLFHQCVDLRRDKAFAGTCSELCALRLSLPTLVSSRARKYLCYARSTAIQPTHLPLFGFTAVDTCCSASDLPVKALVMLECRLTAFPQFASCFARKRPRAKWLSWSTCMANRTGTKATCGSDNSLPPQLQLYTQHHKFWL